MIHISKSNYGTFYTTVTGNNGEVISSHNNLNTKQACIKNLVANMGQFNGKLIVVQDNTLKKPKTFHLGISGKKYYSQNPIEKAPAEK